MPLIKNDKSEWLNFIHIPKAGGSSLEDMVAEYYECSFMPPRYVEGVRLKIDDISIQHIDREIIKALGVDKVAEKSFCLVRNPVDRIISEYNYNVKHKPLFKYFFCFNSFCQYAINKSFKEKNIFDGHIRPQSDFILNDTEIFKLENGFSKVIYELNNKYNLSNIKVEKHNNKSGGNDVIIYDDTLDLIESYYKLDFENFGYSLIKHSGLRKSFTFKVKSKVKAKMYDTFIFLKRGCRKCYR